MYSVSHSSTACSRAILPGRNTVLHPAHKVGLGWHAQPAPQKILEIKGNSIIYKYIGRRLHLQILKLLTLRQKYPQAKALDRWAPLKTNTQYPQTKTVGQWAPLKTNTSFTQVVYCSR